MTTYLIQIDDSKPYEQSANLLSEILDDATPKHSASRLKVSKRIGLGISGGSWKPRYSEPRRFVWDDFDGEWANV